jgi:hypothetical protein
LKAFGGFNVDGDRGGQGREGGGEGGRTGGGWRGGGGTALATGGGWALGGDGGAEDEEERRQRTKWRTRRMGLTREEEHWAEG